MIFRKPHPIQQDHYQILGVSRSSTPDEIKKAFRDLVKFHHPDQYTQIEEKEAAGKQLREIIHSYKVLSNPQNRLHYDFQHNQHQIDTYSFWNRHSLLRKRLRKVWRRIGAPAILAGAIFTYALLGIMALIALLTFAPHW